MKYFKSALLSLAFLAAAMTFTACGGDGDTAEQGKEYTSAYICPMHCEGSGSDKAGKCPVCKMDYVANENFKGEKPKEATGHEGHDHGSHEGHNH